MAATAAVMAMTATVMTAAAIAIVVIPVVAVVTVMVMVTTEETRLRLGDVARGHESGRTDQCDGKKLANHLFLHILRGC